MNPDYKQPSFFKIILDGLTNEHLRIPPKFVKHISKELSETVILKGPSGEPCHAKLCKNTTGMYIEDGWKQFLSDHSLGDNEFLTFTYEGKMSFDVQIFDKSGCERIPLLVRNSNRDSASCSKGKLKQGRLNKNPVGSSSLHPHHPNEHNISETSKGFWIRQHSAEEERQKNVETAESFTSEFPHFKVCLTYSSARKSSPLQPVPTVFCRANPLPSIIIIRNSQGRAWEVNCVPCDERYIFSGGWSAFIRGNELKIGDVCIFERIDEGIMQVHIFHSS